MKHLKNSLSLKVLVVIGVILSVYRVLNISEKEISWDILGYYMPLPAIFVHDDPMLDNIDWLKKVNEEKQLADTLYMVSSNNNGEPMYFFFFGMAMMYLPFFLMGYFFAYTMGFPIDGFSPPFQYMLVIGGIIYTLIGLFYLRKILRHYFSEFITSLVLVLVVFATNYTHHLTLKNLETVNVLFMFVTIIIWNIIKWHEEQKFKNLLFIGLSITMMALIKPSEILIVILPFLWGVFSVDSFKQKFSLLLKYKFHIVIVVAICFLVGLPQVLYWYSKTGEFIYDTYKNNGVGLDIFSPHIIESLFSYRKGWLVYTPIMLFSLIGFYNMYRQNKSIFYTTFGYFLISFYIITSWTEWWYGAGFSNRPVITLYPVLAITMGYFILFIQEQSKAIKYSVAIFAVCCLFLNQFQWWQLRNYILDPYRTTKEYYWATFLKTSVTDKDKELLLVKRDFSGAMNFTNKKAYRAYTFEGIKPSDAKELYSITNQNEFALTHEVPYNSLSDKDHVWIEVSFNIKLDSNQNVAKPNFVFTMDRKEGNYGYYAPELAIDNENANWQSITLTYLTPEIRSKKDRLKYYIWNKGRMNFEVKDLTFTFYERN